MTNEITAAVLSSVLTFIGGIVLTLISVWIYRKASRKDEKKRSFENMIKKQERIENKLNDILKIREEVNSVKKNCSVYHKEYDKTFGKIEHEGDLAKRDIQYLNNELDTVKKVLQELRDSTIENNGLLKKVIALNEEKNREQDKKIDTLFKKLENTK